MILEVTTKSYSFKRIDMMYSSKTLLLIISNCLLSMNFQRGEINFCHSACALNHYRAIIKCGVSVCRPQPPVKYNLCESGAIKNVQELYLHTAGSVKQSDTHIPLIDNTLHVEPYILIIHEFCGFPPITTVGCVAVAFFSFRHVRSYDSINMAKYRQLYSK